MIYIIDKNSKTVLNTIYADLEWAQEAYPDHIVVESDIGGIGWTYDNGAFISPYIPESEPVATVPQSVTMRQARLILLELGLLDDVDAAIDAISDEKTRKAIQIEWEYAMDVRRDWPALGLIASTMGLSDNDLDEMFVNANDL